MVSESFKTSYFTCGKAVLILVLVEDGLGATQSAAKAGDVLDRLNPCFSGGWSRRLMKNGVGEKIGQS